MSSKIRHITAALLAAGALAISASAQAQLRPGASDEQKQSQRQEQRQEPKQRQEQPRSEPRPKAEPRLQAAPRERAAAPAQRPGAAPQPQRPGAAQPPRNQSPPPAGGTRQYSTNGNRNPGFVPRPGGPGERVVRNPRPPRVINRLPPGYRDYHWNGTRYYYYGGSWYRPYGSSFISIGVPYGLFVSTLPGPYSSFWYGGARYFYADHTYYLYEPARRGYVVTRSPYGEDENEGDQGEELFIYPAQGQSEQQQADDRYECHRWAADQSDYNPIDDEYDADRREDYQRAMTACLTGRGYTVK